MLQPNYIQVSVSKFLFLPLSTLWSRRRRLVWVVAFLYLALTWSGGIFSQATSIAARVGINVSEISVPPIDKSFKSVLQSIGSRIPFGSSWKDATVLADGAHVILELTSLTPPQLPSWWANPNLETVKPNAVLDRRASCWPFSGSRGYITVQLSANTSVTQVMLDHPSGSSSRSAPKDVVVWGLYRAQELPTTDLPNDHGLPQTLMEELISARLIPVLLTKFQYNINTEDRSQFINVVGNSNNEKADKVLFQILGNWGGYFTCIYCLRVYGY